ncbi:MAG: hypothetical protein Q9214_006035 [Letrouitia sp. 1 TL-2023]
MAFPYPKMSLTNGSASHSPRTLTFLGCGMLLANYATKLCEFLLASLGTLGTAILCGLLASLEEKRISRLQPEDHGVQTSKAGLKEGPTPGPKLDCYGENHLPSQFIACVRTPESAERLKKELLSFQRPVPVTILNSENARGVQAADSVLLGCQPQDLESCIASPAVSRALGGKVLISILAGVTIPQIEAILSREANLGPATTIVRAMPNTASFVRESTTVVTSTVPEASPALRLVDWLFNSIGSVTHIPATQFDTCTALCGSTPAFFAMFLESLVDGAVALGLKRSEAQIMAAKTMKGAATLILDGETPEMVRHKVATPGGSTIQGLLKMERGAMRATVADALIHCTAAARGLGDTV